MLAGAFACFLASGCSTQQLAADALASALSSDAGNVFLTDDDPELIRDALPFGLKTYESLLAVTPNNAGLLKASAAGFAGYAFLLQQEADLLDDKDFKAAQAQRRRASKLFVRGRDYALAGLSLTHPGLGGRIKRGDLVGLQRTTVADLDFLYWAGASWAGAANLDRNNQDLVADLPIAAALVARVLELDDDYQDGAAHEFFLSYDAAQPGADRDALQARFDKVMEYSQGKRIATLLTYAEVVSRPQQDLEEFRGLIDAALAKDPDADKENRLLNHVAHRRAAWLKSKIPDLFLDAE